MVNKDKLIEIDKKYHTFQQKHDGPDNYHLMGWWKSKINKPFKPTCGLVIVGATIPDTILTFNYRVIWSPGLPPCNTATPASVMLPQLIKSSQISGRSAKCSNTSLVILSHEFKLSLDRLLSLVKCASPTSVIFPFHDKLSHLSGSADKCASPLSVIVVLQLKSSDLRLLRSDKGASPSVAYQAERYKTSDSS